ETWHWDGVSWLRRHPVTSPSRRILFSMSFDPGRRRVVLFGGIGPSGANLDDTWEWDGITWTERTPAIKPPARVGASLACTAGRCLLVGGATGTASPLTYFTDTWAWDGVTW